MEGGALGAGLLDAGELGADSGVTGIGTVGILRVLKASFIGGRRA